MPTPLPQGPGIGSHTTSGGTHTPPAHTQSRWIVRLSVALMPLLMLLVAVVMSAPAAQAAPARSAVTGQWAPAQPPPAPPGDTPPPQGDPPPCEGPNCIPQPVPWAPPAPVPPPEADLDGQEDSECGITNPQACVQEGMRDFFTGVVTGAVEPLMDLLGTTLLTTPEPDSVPSLAQVWTESWHLLLACYGLLVMTAGLVLMAYETLQTRYTVKELAPRLVVGFLAGTLSLFLATKAIQIANALAGAVMGESLDPHAVGALLTGMVNNALEGTLWVVLLALALVVMVVILLLTYLVRVILTILLIAAAPVALMWHALPHTEGIAKAWWKALGGLLAIQVAQSLTLVITLRVAASPTGFDKDGPALSGVMNLLFCVALMVVLIKIPFVCLAPLRSGGRSFAGSLVRGAIAYKTMGLVSGLGALGGNGGGQSGGKDRSQEMADPPSTRSGQFMLPLGVRRRSTPQRRTRRLGEEPERTPPALNHRRPGPGQFSLFTTHGTGKERTVEANPRALPPDPRPDAPPQDQLRLPIVARREPDRVGRRTVADDLADQAHATPPPPAPQAGLLTEDGRINRRARPPARPPRALIMPSTGMLPLTLRPAPPAPTRHTLADELAAEPTPGPPQTGPGLLTRSGQINRAARPPRRRTPSPYAGNRPSASTGQYPLPLGVRRQRRPTRPSAPEEVDERWESREQIPLPLNLPSTPKSKKKKKK